MFPMPDRILALTKDCLSFVAPADSFGVPSFSRDPHERPRCFPALDDFFSMGQVSDPFPEPGQLPALKGFSDPLVLRSGAPVRTAAQWQ